MVGGYCTHIILCWKTNSFSPAAVSGTGVPPNCYTHKIHTKTRSVDHYSLRA